jgi:lipopolysaccharide heptosyltransferase II
MGAQRILVVRIAGIGDVAVASTVIERLRAEQPEARVTFLCGSASAPLARLYEGVSEVLVVDEQALLGAGILSRAHALFAVWSELLRRRFDRVLLLHVDRRYRVLVAPLVGARVSMLSRGVHGKMIPVPARWLGDEYARLVGGTAHVGPIERRFVMADLRDKVLAGGSSGGRGSPTRRRVILVPGGAKNVLRDDALRRWPLAHYGEVARSLTTLGYDVVLLGSETDRWVLPEFEGVDLTREIGTLGLPEALALMHHSDLVIAHDTGPMHLARLVRTPLIAVFGPTIPAQVLWLDDSVTVLWGGEHLACRPCFDGREFARCTNNVCMSSVSPREVLQAVERRLGGRTSPTTDRPTLRTLDESGPRRNVPR